MMRRRNIRVTEQLLGELEAGRFDSALTKRIMEAPSAFPRLLRACFLAQAGEYASARTDLDLAIELAPENPVIQLVAGMVAFATRDYQRALDQFERAGTLSKNAARRGRHLAMGAAGGLGWEHDVRRILETAIARDPDHAAWRAQATRFFTRARHWQRALEHGLAALERAPNAAHMWMEVAGLHARLDHREQCADALERALKLIAEDPKTDREQARVYNLEGARVAIDGSAYPAAVRCLERAIELDGLDPDTASDPSPWVQLAEIASWREQPGENPEARRCTDAALAIDPEFAPALRMDGALHILAGRYSEGIEVLQRAITRDPKEYQAHVWLTEAYLRTQRYSEAHSQLHSGTMNAGGFLFVAWLLRFLIVAYEEQDPPGALPPNRTEEFAGVLRELAPELAPAALESHEVQALVAAVEAALSALRGNRSIYGSHVVNGELTRLETRTGCRFESRWILQLLRIIPGEVCLEFYDEMLPRYPGSSLPICHRGELHMWLGDTAKARVDLETAIETVEGTRWAYIGLAGLQLVDGDLQGSLDTNAKGVRVMNNTEGPAIYVFRGEALRKLGQLEKAIEELEKAIHWHPARVSATVNLALAYQAKGPKPKADEHKTDEHPGFEPLWRRLLDEQACGLLSDAARELGLTIVGDRGWSPETSVKVQVLEHALVMMGYNRSSGLMTYWTRAGQMRFVQHWPHGGRGPHARDHEHLEQAKQMLLKALANYAGPRLA